MEEFDQFVEEYLAADKIAINRLRWSAKRHKDFVEAHSRLIVAPHDVGRGRLIVTAHLSRRPPKYSFSVIARHRRVLGLDMNPGHAHTNVIDLRTVQGTHWQEWPDMDAIEDQSLFTYQQGLHAFLSRANILLKYPYTLPPQIGSTQPSLDL